MRPEGGDGTESFSHRFSVASPCPALAPPPASGSIRLSRGYANDYIDTGIPRLLFSLVPYPPQHSLLESPGRGKATMSPYLPGKTPQQCVSSFASGPFRVPSASNTLLLIHPAGSSLPEQLQSQRRHVRSRPRGATSAALALTDLSPSRHTRHCPRSSAIRVGAGRGRGGGVAWGALRTAASPTAAEVVDAAANTAGGLDGSSGEGREGGERLADGVGLGAVPGAVPGGVVEERAVNGGASSSKVQQQRKWLPPRAPEVSRKEMIEAKKLSSKASGLMRRMTTAGKNGRWDAGIWRWRRWRSAATSVVPAHATAVHYSGSSHRDT